MLKYWRRKLGINRDLRLNSNSTINIYSKQTFRGNKYTVLHLQKIFYNHARMYLCLFFVSPIISNTAFFHTTFKSAIRMLD